MKETNIKLVLKKFESIDSNGLTFQEAALSLGIKEHTSRKIFFLLEKQGHIVKSGYKRKSLGSYPCSIFVLSNNNKIATDILPSMYKKKMDTKDLLFRQFGLMFIMHPDSPFAKKVVSSCTEHIAKQDNISEEEATKLLLKELNTACS